MTTEANPDSVTAASLRALAAGGFTRVSLGMQSAVPARAAHPRAHPRPGATSPARSTAARAAGLQVEPRPHLRHAGGVAGRLAAPASTRRVALEPDHVSAYALVVEEGTRLAAQVRRGEVAAPEDDDEADKYELADERPRRRRLRLVRGEQLGRGRASHPLPPQRGLLGAAATGGASGRARTATSAACAGGTSSTPRRMRRGSLPGTSPAAAREVLTDEQRHDERVLLGIRLVEGLPVDGLPPSGRTAVAGLVADGLVDGPAAVRRPAGACSPARAGCWPTRSCAGSSGDAGTGARAKGQ